MSLSKVLEVARLMAQTAVTALTVTSAITEIITNIRMYTAGAAARVLMRSLLLKRFMDAEVKGGMAAVLAATLAAVIATLISASSTIGTMTANEASPD